MTDTEAHGCFIRVSKPDSQNQAYLAAILQTARDGAADGARVSVTWWDTTSDPRNPGWYTRTYQPDSEGDVTYTDKIL